MSEGQLGVLLSAATLVVVAAASVAAVAQLRYLRQSNHLNALLEILNQWNLPAVQAALSELRAIPEKMKDPTYVATLRTPGSIERTKYPEFLALDLWEQIGTYCKHGLLNETILLDITSAQVLSAWRKCGTGDRLGPPGHRNVRIRELRISCDSHDAMGAPVSQRHVSSPASAHEYPSTSSG